MGNGDTGRCSRGDAALQQPRYGAHGHWPFVLYTVIIAMSLWCVSLSVSLLRGELNGTPVTHGSATRVHVAAVLSGLQMLIYPGIALLYKLLENEYSPAPRRHFVAGFPWCLANSMSSLSIIADLTVSPIAMDPATPGYTAAAAAEYRAWRAIGMPVCVALHITTAVLLIVDGWTWLRYCGERKLGAEREIRSRDRTRRWRIMFDRPEEAQPEHIEMVRGVMGRAHSGEGNKTAGDGLVTKRASV